MNGSHGGGRGERGINSIHLDKPTGLGVLNGVGIDIHQIFHLNVRVNVHLHVHLNFHKNIHENAHI